MSERENIAAFTAFNIDFPGYVSINREPDRRITITVREQGHGGNKQATLEIPDEELRKLARSILTAEQECHCGAGEACCVCDPGG